jgi:hypothetical protein
MAENAAWKLEDFVDSLVVELDKTRETLAVKAINKPLSYTVKEVALDLNTFPTYDGDRVSFVTAQPGQEGSSKITIQLGSITDQQVRATAKAPTAAKGDIPIDQIPVDKTTKDKLRRIGVNTVGDLNQIGKAQRDQAPPRVSGVSLSMSDDGRHLVLKGKHLAVDESFPPVAVVNDELARVQSATPDEVRVELGPEHELRRENEVILTFDPFAVIRLNVRGGDGTA